MRPWKEIVAEAKDRNKEKTEQERRRKIAKTALKGSAALKGEGGRKEGKLSPEELDLKRKELKLRKRFQKTRESGEARKAAHFAWTKEQAEKNKAERLQKLKEKEKNLKQKESESHKEKAKQAIRGIKTEKITDKEGDITAYGKAIGNVVSVAGGVAKAAFHGARHLAAKKAAEKEAKKKTEIDVGTKIPERRERKSGIMGGRPTKTTSPTTSPTASKSSLSSPASSERKEPKRLLPAIKRLAPASKGLPPSGGAPEGSRGPKAITLGQRARQNPRIKSGLISQRMTNEEFSNWREEFIIEIDGKKNKEKIVDVMRGKNKIVINPNMNEENIQEIAPLIGILARLAGSAVARGIAARGAGFAARGALRKKAVDFVSQKGGEMTADMVQKRFKKKFKNEDEEIEEGFALMQSKITKAANHLYTVAGYMVDENEKITESYDDETFRQHSRETFSSHSPSELRARTASVLKKMKEMNANVEKPKKKKKKKKKAVAEECGCMDDKNKVLATAIFKKALSDKKKKNFQLNSGIIGEGVDKESMKCNKPKAQAHGSGETGKSHIVKACEGGTEKIIRFGQLGVKGSPKKEGESKAYASRRHRFQTRHAKNIAKGKMSAAYWSNLVKW